MLKVNTAKITTKQFVKKYKMKTDDWRTDYWLEVEYDYINVNIETGLIEQYAGLDYVKPEISDILFDMVKNGDVIKV